MAIETVRRVEGTAVPVRGDNIDTDRIIPARYLKSVTFDGLERHLFADDRRQTEEGGSGIHPISNPAYDAASILIVNANFGCGSSREHAPQAIRRRGLQAVIGESFSEIFFGNAVALGMPCVSAAADDVAAMMAEIERSPSMPLEIDLEALVVRAAGRSWPITLPSAARESFLDGTWDATGLLLDRFDEVEAVARRLPYLQWS